MEKKNQENPSPMYFLNTSRKLVSVCAMPGYMIMCPSAPDVDVHDSFFYVRRCCKFIPTNERTAWEQGLFAASVNAEQCTNVPHQMFASFSHAAFMFCSHSGVNPALECFHTRKHILGYTYAIDKMNSFTRVIRNNSCITILTFLK